MSPTTHVRLEHAALTLLGLAAFHTLGVSWWWFVGLFLVPDLSMVGYLVDPRTGAVTYNTVHDQTLGLLLGSLGFVLSSGWLQVAGIVLFTHSNADRVLGYGLKHPDDFRHTHLGWIGGGPDTEPQQ